MGLREGGSTTEPVISNAEEMTGNTGFWGHGGSVAHAQE